MESLSQFFSSETSSIPGKLMGAVSFVFSSQGLDYMLNEIILMTAYGFVAPTIGGVVGSVLPPQITQAVLQGWWGGLQLGLSRQFKTA